MRHDFCQEFFTPYVDNAKMLILVNEEFDDIIGRALLWESIDGDLIMDRVYSSEDMYVKFFDWAKDNGYIRKRFQSYSSERSWVYPNGAEANAYFQIEAPSLLADGDYMPYFDTFYYYNGEGLISNSTRGADSILRETDGSYTSY